MRDIDSSHSVCCVLGCLLCLLSAESIYAHRGCQIKILKQLSKIKVKCHKILSLLGGTITYQVTSISHQQFYSFSANIHTDPHPSLTGSSCEEQKIAPCNFSHPCITTFLHKLDLGTTQMLEYMPIQCTISVEYGQ